MPTGQYVRKKRSLENRFWEKVARSESCWEWTGYLDRRGYGRIGTGGRGQVMLLAHRAAWLLHFGTIPDGLMVCHACDNPRCVRVEHLFLGTAKDNTTDARNKGRFLSEVRRMATQARSGDESYQRRDPSLIRRGENSATAKLTWDEVHEIRRIYAAGLSTETALGRRYGVKVTTISAIVRKQTWK
jgi:HNH endonuclease